MIKRFFSDETGLELSEYAVAAALIAMAIVAAFQLLGTNISGKITGLANTVKQLISDYKSRSAPLLPALDDFQLRRRLLMIRKILKDESGLEFPSTQ